MSKARQSARDMVRGGKPMPSTAGEPTPIGQRQGGRGRGGGLPENPEARSAADFGPGGRTRGGARTGA